MTVDLQQISREYQSTPLANARRDVFIRMMNYLSDRKGMIITDEFVIGVAEHMLPIIQKDD